MQQPANLLLRHHFDMQHCHLSCRHSITCILVCQTAMGIRGIVFDGTLTAMARNRAMGMAMVVALEEEGEGEGGKSDGDGDKEGNGEQQQRQQQRQQRQPR
jgi:hypothetical protein